MSRRCELTGVGPMVGHNIKTKRRFLPSLASTALYSESLKQSVRLKVSKAALRTLDFKGGLDVYLLKASDEVLSPRAQKLKRQVKARATSGARADAVEAA